MRKNCMRWIMWVGVLGILHSVSLASGLVHENQTAFFVANEGQWDAPFAFQAQVGNATYFVTPAGLTIDLREYERRTASHDPLDRVMRDRGPEPTSVRGHVLKLNFVNGNVAPEIVGEDKLSSYSNYFLGRDSCQWRSRVPHYQRVLMKDVWPGIDVELVAQDEGVETVYHVAPYADPSQIEIEVEGLESPLSVDANGRLQLPTSLGALTEQVPYAYQDDSRMQKSVAARYQVLSASRYTLTISGYDPQKEVVIDPLIYGSYLGGYSPEYYQGALAIDPLGNKVVAGLTQSYEFPVTPGAYEDTLTGVGVFVTKFSPGGDSLIFSALLGGGLAGSHANGLASDATGGIVVVGATTYQQWPLTLNAVDTVIDVGDAFVTYLSADGTSLNFSSYLGGTGGDEARSAYVDVQGIVHVAGTTGSGDFPVTSNALFSTYAGEEDLFLTSVDPVAGEIVYSTFIGGSASDGTWGLQMEGDGRFWIWGTTSSSDFPLTDNAFQTDVHGPTECFCLHADLAQQEVLYSTLLGGNSYDDLRSFANLSGDRFALAGHTNSTDFPVTGDAFDTTNGSGGGKSFVTVLSESDGMIHSTVLGGPQEEDGDWLNGLHVLPTGDFVVGGYTYSNDFPVTPGAYDTVFNNNGAPGYTDAFLCVLSAELNSVLYGTYLGGWNEDNSVKMVAENDQRYWLAGFTYSSDLPVTPNAVQPTMGGLGDVFLMGFDLPELSAVDPRNVPLPTQVTLFAYPNPFNSQTRLAFSLTRPTLVTFRIYDVLGRLCVSQGLGTLSAGEHTWILDSGSMPSGSYMVRLNAANDNAVCRITILR